MQQQLKEGKKDDQGKNRMELISPIALAELAKVLTFGARKYEDRNWEKGMKWSRVMGALLRHLVSYMAGERIDRETGLSNMAHVLCCAMFLVHFEKAKQDFDDLPRYTQPGE